MELQYKMTKVCLRNTLAYKWTVTDCGCVRGYAYVEDDFLQGDTLLSYLLAASTQEELEAKFARLEGLYSIILDMPFGVAACVDQARSMPLFYRLDGEAVILWDALDEPAIIDAELDQEMVSVFKNGVCVPNDRTIFQDFYQVKTGCYVLINGTDVRQYPHFKMTYAEHQITDPDEAIPFLDELYLQTFRRTVRTLNGRTAIIPLSGGHDSRLEAFYLKERLGYSNIIAYSYGSPGNDEASYAKQVAEILNIPFHFIPSDLEGMLALYEAQSKDYFLMSGNGTSTPHLQEWYHVYKLKQQRLIPEDGVFIPGYAGDFTAGEFIWRSVAQIGTITPEAIMNFRMRDEFRPDYILGKREIELSETDLKAIRRCMYEEYPELRDSSRTFTPKEAGLMIEQSIASGWYSKFIENAVRAFDYFGYTWLTPFFERSLFEGWSKIDHSLRIRENVYFELAKRIYSEKLKNLGFANAQTTDWKFLIKQLMRFPKNHRHYAYGYFGEDLDQEYYQGLKQNQLKGPNVYIQNDYLNVLQKICKGM